MKKIAFYVEGLTEQFFLNKLLVEIAGSKNIEIILERFQGLGMPHDKEIYPKTSPRPINPKHHALIVNCGGDESVKARILENYAGHISNGYSEIIGLVDLYPRTDLEHFENLLLNGIVKNQRIITNPLPPNASIVVAVKEIESWFLSECKHFMHIDNMLSNFFISSNVGYDPCTDDMTLIDHPAGELHRIYQLAGHVYMNSNGKKRKNKIERTVEYLDYSDIYIKLRKNIKKLLRNLMLRH